MKAAIPLSLALFLCVDTAAAQPAAPEPPFVPAETIQVQAPPLTDEAVVGFVKTFTTPSLLSGKIPRWFSGICLKIDGLPAALSAAMTKRVLEIARMAGAPVQDQPCSPNTIVVFDPDPQAVMDDIVTYTPGLLGPHDPAQAREIARMRFPVQAWYATATRDEKGIKIEDRKEPAPFCEGTETMSIVPDGGNLTSGGFRGSQGAQQAVARALQRDCGQRAEAGSRLRDGIKSQLTTVTVVAAADTVNLHDPGAVADYLALVILSQTKAFDTCQRMETIANLLVPRCDTGGRITGLMPGDIAFLKALYKADTGGTLVAQQSSITTEMKKLLNAP